MAGTTDITPEARIGGVPIQQSAEGTPVALLYGRNRLSVNLVWYGDFESVEKRTSQGGGKGGGVDTVTYDYYASLISCVGQGPMSLVSVWRGKSKYSAADAASQLCIGFMSGQQGQATWAHLTSSATAQAIGYSNTGYLYAQRYALDQGAQIPNHTVEVENTQFGSRPSPMAVVIDLLLRSGVPVDALGSTSDAQAYALGLGIYACPVYTSLSACADMVNDLATIGNVGLVSSEGLLKFIPYGASTVGSYVPNATPAYNLTDDDFICDVGADPIKVTRKSEADTYNHIKVQYADASREYNTAISEAKDDESIARSGIRTKDSISLNGITDAQVARLVAQQILQREIALRNTYEFTLGARYARLEPMDYVTLTDSYLGLDKLVVRIIEIEDQDDVFSIKAEDAPMAAFTPAAYAFQKSAGFVGNYNAAPKSVVAPVFFQSPIKYTGGSGIVVRVAVTGPDATWGGCAVWMSVDGNNYRQLGQTKTRTRYGNLTAPLSLSDVSMAVALVGVGGQLLSGSAADADSGSTMCWVGLNGKGEYLSYQTSALQAANTYQLNSLRRGMLNSVPSTLTTGAAFVRVDNDIFETEPLPREWHGQTICFKFTSLNQYGSSMQSLADVVAYPYVLQHQLPSIVNGLTLAVTSNGVLVTWDKSVDADYLDTELRMGSSWDTSELIVRKAGSSHLLGWQKNGQALTIVARNRDGSLSYSATAATCSLTISASASVQNLILACVTTGLQASWTVPALTSTSQPIDRVELSWSSNFASVVEAKKSTTATFAWVTPGLKELFVRVIDVAGNVGNTASVTITVRAPAAPSALAVAIGSSGVAATWNAPAVATDQQPLDGVQLSWMANFGQLIETRSGTSVALGWMAVGSYTLYARYVDAAGNTGASASVVFDVAVPSAPSALDVSFGTSSIEAKWTAPAVAANQQTLDRVELSWTSAFTTVVDGKKASTTTFGWMTAGTYTLYARYVDMAGNIGAVSQATLQVLPPSQPVMTSVETQINAVTLRWQDAKTVQPIRKYSIYYGEAGTLIGAATLYGAAGADSRSDLLFYRSSGNKVAYLVAEDVAGNQSPPRQIDLVITMPNNFVLASEYYESWQSAELTNGTIVNGPTGQIILPANDGRTWGQRLSNSGWTTAQQKIDAGYPIVVQPVPASGKHVEQHDLGKLLATGIVRVTPTVQSSVAGYTATIRLRGSNGDTLAAWQPWLTGDSASISNFRYIEVEYSVVSDGKGFVVLDDLYVKVEISEVSESTVLTLNAADTAGTAYVCTKPFLDVRTAQATALASPNISRLNCIVDDTTLPAKVFVQAWDSNLNRVSGTVSLFIAGV